nr:GNAT family protein [Frankia canadensis]
MPVSPPTWATPILSGRLTRLEPLRPDHVDGLVRAATEDRRSYEYTGVPATRKAMADYVETALAERDHGLVVPFVLHDLRPGRGGIVGCTRFLDLDFWRPTGGQGEQGRTFQHVTISHSWTDAHTSPAGDSSLASTVTVRTVTGSTTIASRGDTEDSASSREAAEEHTRPCRTTDGDPACSATPAASPSSSASGDLSTPPSVVEVGATWLAASAQRTGINVEAKLLLLGHAFDTWNALRVCLKTDVRNHRSRMAIERLGGRFEGIRRAHMLAIDGTARDSAYYSILGEEWPQVRTSLLARLTRN